ncbi:hypothetical protein MLD38_000989 [Melastoma candidum]|uniref:Uncharacterized protein n=1 Tax=Melastoma candidum TaxID=119954 RepID=A0ACB9SGR2_9MYRT|nr:hypothetical protein MLD38_000989 [Melastoma candidum]
MEEITSASPPKPPHAATVSDSSKRKSAGSGYIKRHCMPFAVSLEEGLRYVKALLLGQAKKLTAKNEKEALEADLRTSKMQVEAADSAEDTKMRIRKYA